jgi:hypothetical protein
MANENIATYLKDHLAGSVVAIELLEHLERACSESGLCEFFRQLRKDIDADRNELQTLMAQLHISESPMRKASAWLAEKMTELKLRALAQTDFLYLSTVSGVSAATAKREFDQFSAAVTLPIDLNTLPIITHDDLRLLVSRIYRGERVARAVTNIQVPAAIGRN